MYLAKVIMFAALHPYAYAPTTLTISPRPAGILVDRRGVAPVRGVACNDMILDEVFDKVAFEAMTGCWIWTGQLVSPGYGRVPAGRRYLMAHRWVYEKLIRPIPPGLEIDHMCKNKACVNPLHLDPVTPAENLRRSPTASTINAKKTHCPRGHEYDSIGISKGDRRCRRCTAAGAKRRYYERKNKP